MRPTLRPASESLRVLATALLVAAAPSAPAATQTADDRLHVLFLGDNGHHEPALRADAVYAPLARAGIALDYTGETADLRDDLLDRYDALLIYANHDQIAPEQERALLRFVEQGGGLVAVHCASYCFRNSDAYVALVGGQFDRHGMAEFTARSVAPAHAAMTGVGEFTTTDETYVHRRVAADVTLLQTRDEGGRPEPCTWVRTQGTGRVYYTALGHDARTWDQPAFHGQLAQAIRWAAGRPGFRFELPAFRFQDANLPNYRADLRWGETGEPIRKLQAPLPPEEEQELLQVPAGFAVELFAAEPQVVKPIALSFDARERPWIAEALDYPNDQQPPGQGNDRIRILTDADRDGRADRATLFADRLSLVTGLVCVDRGCIVAQAPDVLLLLDHDGDDHCDERRVLFTGFGTGDTHAGPSNFRRGPDGWIWGTVGYSGFKGDVGGEHHEFSQAVFRFLPDGSRLERVASTSNNTWGLGFSSDGEVFVSTANNEHLVHVVLPAQALDAIPGLPTSATARVADHGRVHSLLPLRQVDAFGGYTAAANAAISTSFRFPPEYFDRVAFVCEPTAHVVHRCLLERRGATFASRDGWNMLASLDEWTAPIVAEPGPDGALWVLDWYSPVIQHNPTPRGFETGKGNAYETPHRDKQHGRIWRIVWAGGSESVDGLIKALVAEKKAEAERARTTVLHPAPWPPPERRLVTRDGVLLALPADPKERAERLLAFVDETADGGDPWPRLAATLAAAGVWREFLTAALASTLATDVVRGGSAPAEPAAANLLVNESAEELEGATPRAWRSATYGGAASFDLAPAGRAGGRALRITSSRGADSSWSQTVAVRPNATYRLSGWIKTEQVEPLGEAQGALFNVHELQSPRIVRTPAIVGTRDWTKVEVTFETGGRESLTINALLGGWGLARGTALWDDLRLERIGAVAPELEVVRRVASAAARTEPASMLPFVEQLAAAAPGPATALLEGLADGWPRGMRLPRTPATDAALRTLPAQLAPPARAALLLFAERCGLLDLYPSELTTLTEELRSQVSAKETATDEKIAAARRLLLLAPGEDSVRRVAAELSTLADPALVKAMALALGECGEEASGAALVARLPQLTPATMPVAIEVLLRRGPWQQRLLQEVLAGKLDQKLLATDVLDRLGRSKDPAVSALAAQVAGRSGRPPNPNRQKVLEKWLPLADRRGDALRGAAVFAEQCAKCHTLNGKGGPIGPDLTNIGTRGRHELLLEILDPNRSVEGTWRAYDATLRNGDSVSGRLVGESRTTVELLDATATRHVLARDDIAELLALSRSLMPEGFEELGEADLCALLEYLTTEALPRR